MAYRRRDNSQQGGYSSADAYRAVPNTSTAPQHTSRARSGSRARRRESQEEAMPLSPPRPQFIAGDDRRSWSSSEPDGASDSDSGAGFAGVGAAGGNNAGVGAAGRTGAAGGVHVQRVSMRIPHVRSATQPVPGPGTPGAAQMGGRARAQRRASNMNSDHDHDEPLSPSSHGHSSIHSLGPNPFGSPTESPRNSYYASNNPNAPPAVPEKNGAQRNPPSAYPFQSHAGNPDPVPRRTMDRRNSLESLRDDARSPSNSGHSTYAAYVASGQPHALNAPMSATANNPLSPTGTGTAYPSGGAGGYGPIGAGEVDDLGRPYAPYMADATDRSQTPPSPMRGGPGAYAAVPTSAPPSAPSTPKTPNIVLTPAFSSTFAASASTPPTFPPRNSFPVPSRPYANSNAYPSLASQPPSQPSDIGGPGLPRTSSVPTINMRAPFLSPASRPGSSLWAPPSYPYGYAPASGSSTALNNYAGAGSFGGGSGYLYPGQYPSYQDIQSQLRKSKPIMPSSRITQKLTVEDKPWLATRSRRERVGYWLTIMGMIIGCGVAGVLIWYNYTGQFYLTDSQLCSVFSEDWSGGLDLSSTWVADNELGGFDHGEFQATTQLSQNLYVSDNELYIMPTLTSDYIDSTSKIFDGYTFKVPDCSTTNTTACEVSSSNSTGAVVNPVMSARISTQGKYSIQYGRVEVVAKIPSGDWLWPAIWMLPVNNTYGAWPMSGEIDIMMARGNPSSYPAQGVDYVRGQLIYGVMASLQTTLYGWWDSKMTPYSEGFHTYSLEWTADWMRIYVDSRLHAMVESKIQGRGGKSFFDRGDYPTTTQNGSSEVVVENIWEQAGGGPNAPFDQEFYLILDVAAGGTNGWFPDSEGDKPWYDGSDTAMREFAEAQSTWAASWPSDAADRAFRVSSVKMWKLC